MRATDKYKFSKDYVWDLHGAPTPVLGAGVAPAVPFAPDEFPAILTTPGSPLAFAANINGVQNEIALWTAPVADAARPDAPWQPLVSRADAVTNVAVSGTRIFLMSHKDAPTSGPRARRGSTGQRRESDRRAPSRSSYRVDRGGG